MRQAFSTAWLRRSVIAICSSMCCGPYVYGVRELRKMKPTTRPSTISGQVRLERTPSLISSLEERLRGWSFTYASRSLMMRGSPLCITSVSVLPRRPSR